MVPSSTPSNFAQVSPTHSLSEGTDANGAILAPNPNHDPNPLNSTSAGSRNNIHNAHNATAEERNSLNSSSAPVGSDGGGAEGDAGPSTSSNRAPSASTISDEAIDAPESSNYLSELIVKLNDMRTEMEQVSSSMSPSEAAVHSAQLSELAGVLNTCVSKFTIGDVSGNAGAKSEATHPDNPVEKEAEQPPETFLDTLPVRCIVNLVRHFSARPRTEYWSRHIKSIDAESLYLWEGPLGESFRKKFTNIQLSTVPFRKLNYDEIHLDLKAPRSGTNTVLERCGKNIKRLGYVGDRSEVSLPHMTAWIEPYRLHCNNITHLSLSRVNLVLFDEILKVRSGELRSLTLDSYTSSRPHLHMVGRYCTGLKKLSMFAGLPAPELLWEKLGPSLEELEISPSFEAPPSNSILINISKHCKNLTRFVLNDESPKLKEKLNLLKGLGEKLTFAKVDLTGFESSEVRDIGIACPNATFELGGISRLRSKTIVALGYRIETLTFRAKPGGEIGIPDNFFANLTHLKTISLSGLEEAVGWPLFRLLEDPKPKLREIKVTSFLNFPAEILELIATKMTQLNALNLYCREIPVEGLEKVVKSNKGLQQIMLKSSKAASFERIRRVLNICAECKELKELRIVRCPPPPPPKPIYRTSPPEPVGNFTANEIARTIDACMPFRLRNTFVQIHGVDYFC